ncbi:trypsin-like serine peptidase [Streptomyces chartreusis]
MHSSRLSPWVLAGLTVLITLLAAGCSQGQRQLPAFSNPVVPGLWTPDRMAEAESIDNPVANDLGEDAGISDPEPRAVPAASEKTPYRDNAAVIGKLFFDTPDGPSVCSGSAVADPARPGASSLVWTAGHCVHAGANGTWFRNIVFVPSYNDEALEGAARGNASQGQVAPFGTWWADHAETSPQWIEQGGPSGGDGAAFDFAVLHVRPPDSSGATSLQETIGQAAPVWFDAPSATRIPAIKAWGYPAASPFDGERMFSCQDRPGRLSVNADQPTLYRIGCTMTGGSSGGGWFAQNTDGALALVSNTSIGPADNTWLAGPRLGADAKRVYGAVSDRFSSGGK